MTPAERMLYNLALRKRPAITAFGGDALEEGAVADGLTRTAGEQGSHRMTRLQSDLLRAKARLQTRILMQRHRVWRIDTPRWTEAELREAWGK